MIGGDISSSGDTPGDPDEAALEEVLKNKLGDHQAVFEQSLNQSGAAAEPNIGGDISTASIVDRTWGFAKLLFARDDQDVGKRLPALLQALRALQPDQSFSRDSRDRPSLPESC